jgi:hypothetical protein
MLLSSSFLCLFSLFVIFYLQNLKIWDLFDRARIIERFRAVFSQACNKVSCLTKAFHFDFFNDGYHSVSKSTIIFSNRRFLGLYEIQMNSNFFFEIVSLWVFTANSCSCSMDLNFIQILVLFSLSFVILNALSIKLFYCMIM